MRSCLTQISKVFRKRSSNDYNNECDSERNHLNESKCGQQFFEQQHTVASKPKSKSNDKKIGNEQRHDEDQRNRNDNDKNVNETQQNVIRPNDVDNRKFGGGGGGGNGGGITADNGIDDNQRTTKTPSLGGKKKFWRFTKNKYNYCESNHQTHQQQNIVQTSPTAIEANLPIAKTKSKSNATATATATAENNSIIHEYNKRNAAKICVVETSSPLPQPLPPHTYIDEYKTFVEDKQQLGVTLASPYPEREFCNFEETFNLNAIKRNPSLKTQLHQTKSSPQLSQSRNTLTIIDDTTDIAKTPEEIEYEAKVAAESEDVMTPLPLGTQLSFGRNVQPEIIEIIRNLDAHALRINNLTLEDKLELLRRFDGKNQRRLCRQGSRKGSQSFSQSNDDGGEDSPEVILRRQLINVDELTNCHMSSSSTSACSNMNASGLYERRQPKTPKLKLLVKATDTKDNKKIYHIVTEIEDVQKNLMDLKYPTVLPPNPQLKALLVFYKTDNICEVMTQACHRQQLEVTVVKSKEAALESLSNTNATNMNASSNNTNTSINTSSDCYHLIIIDARSSKYLDAEYITRSIRHTNGHHFTTIIAVVKKSFFEKDDVLIALLDAGVNRCMVETTNLALCSVELKQILHSIVRPHNVMSTQQALYTALHRLKEVLIITDDVLRIQYANKSAERLLNMRLDEIISKPLAEIFVSDVSSISAHGKPVREFDGILTVRRKSQDGIPMHVRVVPVACIGRTPTHYIFNFDVPGGQTDFIATLPQPKEAPRGSLHSIRRGSFDVRSVASDGLRRTSLAKLTSLPLEAPITKIINLLSQVQENCSADEARLIDKVMEFLKREGLYSPQMKEIRTEDPIATDLIGALLTGPSLYSSRRSSNDSIIRVSTARPSGSMPAKMKATPLIMELLEESLSWEFDMFKLEDITERRPLLYLGMEMFRRFDVFATFNVEENVCKGWLAVIEANYHAQNSYHNSTHAADVMQATGAFLNQLANKDMGMDRMDEVTALIAAAAHDIDHPGRSSAFLCNSNSPLAILYNDLTVLESHHAATTFKLTLEDDKINIFKNLDKDTYKSVRSTIIDMILATEMTRHFEHLAKFVSVFGTDVEPRDIVQSEDESSILIRRMLIKVADVSNPARPTAFCVEWARRIAEEYFMQTDEEKARALPIVMPMFDRATCSIPKSQIGFIEYIIQDMMHAWDSFIDMPQLITYMQINYSQWKKYEEQGIHTLADIKSKQVSLNAKKGTCK